MSDRSETVHATSHDGASVEARTEEALTTSDRLTATQPAVSGEPQPRTGIVKRIYTSSTAETPITHLRAAADKTLDGVAVLSDDALRDAVEQQFETVVIIECTVAETPQRRTLAWFQRAFPRDAVTAMAGVSDVARLPEQRLPLIVDQPTISLPSIETGYPFSQFQALLVQYDALTDADEPASGFHLAGLVGATSSVFALYVLLVVVLFSASAVTLGALLGGLLLVNYAVLSSAWPTDTRYARQLRPNWLL